MFFGCVQNFADRLLDADVHRVETVVAQDDVDQVLADVVHVAANRGEQNLALAGVICLLDVRC